MQKKQKGSVGLWALIIIALVVVSVGIYFWQKNKASITAVTPVVSQVVTTTNSSTQPASSSSKDTPSIISISPQPADIASTVTITGNNLAPESDGPEGMDPLDGRTNISLENSLGQTYIILPTFGTSTWSDDSVTFQLPAQMCDTSVFEYSGCSNTPVTSGTYSLVVFHDDLSSNPVSFTVAIPSSMANWKTFSDNTAIYGLQFEYPPSWGDATTTDSTIPGVGISSSSTSLDGNAFIVSVYFGSGAPVIVPTSTISIDHVKAEEVSSSQLGTIIEIPLPLLGVQSRTLEVQYGGNANDPLLNQVLSTFLFQE